MLITATESWVFFVVRHTRLGVRFGRIIFVMEPASTLYILGEDNLHASWYEEGLVPLVYETPDCIRASARVALRARALPRFYDILQFKQSDEKKVK